MSHRKSLSSTLPLKHFAQSAPNLAYCVLSLLRLTNVIFGDTIQHSTFNILLLHPSIPLVQNFLSRLSTYIDIFVDGVPVKIGKGKTSFNKTALRCF